VGNLAEGIVRPRQPVCDPGQQHCGRFAASNDDLEVCRRLEVVFGQAQASEGFSAA
jgi:hypothetical protein